ncbi:phenylalanine ammonia-lyase [Aspergillus heteromorphus CBS 117.55]|uniref:Phenylalanine ammonia-lyase n=1 Tax=Aspergillus heteromorphus CBS 117.55 TaxID=1448321 RepID=A0A317WP33_9EURO|nr:phenylalanine ammonia-lyase [Aspergillus heteromorphus CBS 117.55]PWY86688.1 phenylalanine ammonia-lyase [Aspergillus heteromorphus CBS 117.55]
MAHGEGSTANVNGSNPAGFTNSVLASLHKLSKVLALSKLVNINGNTLDMADVVAVAKYNRPPTIQDQHGTNLRMNASVNFLNDQLAAGETIYGVNTGFGGSADARTDNYGALQKALIQHHNAGILLPSDRGVGESLVQDSLKSHNIPPHIVKAAMLTRCNSLVRGHSAVRPVVVQSIVTLIGNDLTPIVPLRGSISASGDLTPLAYIAGALEGNPDIYVDSGKGNRNKTIASDEALRAAGLAPLSFKPKEALGLLNGTAFCAGAAALVLFEANQMVMFAQVLTAMSTEALMGTRLNFHPFIATVRPHPGQKEAAENMYAMLKDSHLASDATPESVGLAQDRYALRTSSQWIGPQIETMELATSQVERELNSSTDNPLLDSVNREVHHGGNFQGAAVTSAVEKTMTCMLMLGKMIFGQCSEILNPMFSKGLPPNLCADDPSLSFAFKGVDINMASYISELAYVARPVSNFVHSAEMHNQSINSLALIGARYASDTVEIVGMMVATHLYVLCQALDLRVLQLEFERIIQPRVFDITRTACNGAVADTQVLVIQQAVWKQLLGQWSHAASLDLVERAQTSASNTVGVLLSQLYFHRVIKDGQIPSAALQQWQDSVVGVLTEEYQTSRSAFFVQQTTQDYLCTSSKILYCYVRETLKIPLHRGIEDHPTYSAQSTDNAADNKVTIGSHISAIYLALREGDLMQSLASCFEIPQAHVEN